MDVVIPKPHTGSETTHLLKSDHKIQVLDHKQYNSPSHISPENVLPDPLDQFRSWFSAAQPFVCEPEAMALSTVSSEGTPSTRIVLLKQADTTGFVFYTNYESRKGREIKSTGKASVAFYWRETSQQVRVVGTVENILEEESDAYFRSRPIGSKLGAWASAQSSVIEDGVLEKNLDAAKERFGVKDHSGTIDVPRPEFWGGWRIIPRLKYDLPALVVFLLTIIFAARWSFGLENHLDYTTVSGICAKKARKTGRSRNSLRDAMSVVQTSVVPYKTALSADTDTVANVIRTNMYQL